MVEAGLHKSHYGAKASSLERSRDQEFLRRRIVLNPQHIGLTTNLAVFDIVLTASPGLIHCGGIPFAAAGALKTGFHRVIIHQRN